MKGIKKMFITLGCVLIATILVVTLSNCAKRSNAMEVYNV